MNLETQKSNRRVIAMYILAASILALSASILIGSNSTKFPKDIDKRSVSQPAMSQFNPLPPVNRKENMAKIDPFQKEYEDRTTAIFFKLKDALKYGQLEFAVEEIEKYKSYLIEKGRSAPSEYIPSFERIIKANDDIDAVQKMNVSEDEKLGRIALIHFYLDEGNEFTKNEVCWNIDAAEATLKEMEQKYPKSNFTAEVKLKLLDYGDENSHEGGSEDGDLAFADDYKKFIEEYPGHKEMPRIMNTIGTLIFGSLYPDQSDKHNIDQEIGRINEAIRYHEDVMAKYPNHPESIVAKKYLENIKEYICLYGMELKIQTDKEKYDLNEPIEFGFALKNITSKKIEVVLDDNEFKVMVNIKLNETNSMIDLPRAVPFDYEKRETKTFVLQPNEIYSEKWRINDISNISSTEKKIQRYKMEYRGVYEIAASIRKFSKSIESNIIRITIQE
jgi:hypothetical protein